MSFFAVKSANTLFEQGRQFQTQVVNGQLFAGFGRFNGLNFEFPLITKKVNQKQWAVEAWDIDDTNIVYSFTQFGKKMSTYHTTIAHLKYDNLPMAHFLNIEKVKNVIQKQGFYRYIDEELDAEVRIVLS